MQYLLSQTEYEEYMTLKSNKDVPLDENIEWNDLKVLLLKRNIKVDIRHNPINMNREVAIFMKVDDLPLYAQRIVLDKTTSCMDQR